MALMSSYDESSLGDSDNIFAEGAIWNYPFILYSLSSSSPSLHINILLLYIHCIIIFIIKSQVQMMNLQLAVLHSDGKPMKPVDIVGY